MKATVLISRTFFFHLFFSISFFFVSAVHVNEDDAFMTRLIPTIMYQRVPAATKYVEKFKKKNC